MNTCIVTGTCIDVQENPVANVDVSAHLLGSDAVYNDGVTEKALSSEEVRTKTATDGTWSLTLTRSAYIYRDGVAGVGYKIRLKGFGFDEFKDVTIPDAATVKYEDL